MIDIVEQDNKTYILSTNSKGDQKEHLCTPCIIRIDAFIKREESDEYLLQISAESGEERYIIFTPYDLSAPANFKKKFFSKALSPIRLDNRWLDALIEYWVEVSSPKIIKMFEKSGHYGTHFISPGEIIELKKSIFQIPSRYELPVFWKDSSTGFMLSDAAEQGLEGVQLAKGDHKEILRMFVDGLFLNQKETLNGLIILAYFKASLFATLIYQELGWFPLLFVGGQKESGKNFILNKMFRLFGKDTMGYAVSMVSKVGLNRTLAQVIDFPVWVDEFRNDRESEAKLEQLIRSVYNRSSEVKALGLTTNSTYGVKPTGTLVLSGESLPQDSATRDRFIHVFLSKKTQNRDVKHMVDLPLGELSKVGRAWVLQRMDAELDDGEFTQGLQKSIARVASKSGASDRVSKSYGVIAYFLASIAEELNMDAKFLAKSKTLYDYIESESADREEADNVSKFFEDFITVASFDYGLKVNRHYKMLPDGLAFHIPSVFQAIKAYKRRQGEEVTFSQSTIKSYLIDSLVLDEEEHYVPRRIGGRLLKVLLVPKEALPEDAKDFFSSQELDNNITDYPF